MYCSVLQSNDGSVILNKAGTSDVKVTVMLTKAAFTLQASLFSDFFSQMRFVNLDGCQSELQDVTVT